jgi:hypothetical protein
MVESGTYANEAAVKLATSGDDSLCLFAMGSYGGGEGMMFHYSSTKHSSSKRLSVPSFPHEVENKDSSYQIVALPYYVPCASLNAQKLSQYEVDCLAALNNKFCVAKLGGAPFKAILLELILCGTGGELSDKFLTMLGKLCKHYMVIIIVDEVMTGGRVGPNMTLTSTTPTEFRSQVEFVTMGKFMKCGLILKKVPNRPTECESTRGKSTEASPSEPYRYWQMVMSELIKGSPKLRRKEVVAKMGATAHEDNWGRGSLVFTARSRPGSKKGLKNRHLPMLNDVRIYKGTTRISSWNRTSVCELLMDTAEAWMKEMADLDKERFPFVSLLSKVVLDTEMQDFTADAVLGFVGEDAAEKLAEAEREKRKRFAAARGARCGKKAKTFIQEALGEINVNAADLFTRTRVGRCRQLVYRVDRAQLVAGWIESFKSG